MPGGARAAVDRCRRTHLPRQTRQMFARGLRGMFCRSLCAREPREGLPTRPSVGAPPQIARALHPACVAALPAATDNAGSLLRLQVHAAAAWVGLAAPACQVGACRGPVVAPAPWHEALSRPSLCWFSLQLLRSNVRPAVRCDAVARPAPRAASGTYGGACRLGAHAPGPRFLPLSAQISVSPYQPRRSLRADASARRQLHQRRTELEHHGRLGDVRSRPKPVAGEHRRQHNRLQRAFCLCCAACGR